MYFIPVMIFSMMICCSRNMSSYYQCWNL